MDTLIESLKGFFTRLPLPQTAFQLSSAYLSGMFFSSKEIKNKSFFVIPLEENIIEPSFYKKNIINPSSLEKSMKIGLTRLKSSEHKIIFLLPEISQKVFIFPFDSLPPSLEEKEQFIRFKIKKQMPVMPKDNRITFALEQSNRKGKIIASIAREAVIREYEEFFNKINLKIKMAGIPSLGLLNLFYAEKEKDFALIDIEDQFFTLIVIINSEIAFYRQKNLSVKAEAQKAGEKKAENILQEIITTANFIEDKEKRKIRSLKIRMGMLDRDTEILQMLKEKLAFPIESIESSIKIKIPSLEKRILAPLIGQIL